MNLFKENSIDFFHIMTTLYCNYQCKICTTDSSPKNKTTLSQKELERVQAVVKNHPPSKIVFTGGEPTFGIPDLNSILNCHPHLDQCEVMITSNGWFSKSEKQAIETLSAIKKLDHLEISYDQYHEPVLTLDQLKRLKNVSESLGIKISFTVAVNSLLDIETDVKYLKDHIGGDIVYQKIEQSGVARENDLFFKFSKFNQDVLNQKCPVVDQLSYICGKGFSICRSNMMFNYKLDNEVYHKEVSDHLKSEFYLTRKNLTFNEMLKNYNINPSGITKNQSTRCSMCEWIWHQSKKNEQTT